MTSEGEFEVCEVHSITGVTWDVPAGGGLGSLFKVSGEVLCCDGTGAFDKKVAASAAVCINIKLILNHINVTLSYFSKC